MSFIYGQLSLKTIGIHVSYLRVYCTRGDWRPIGQACPAIAVSIRRERRRVLRGDIISSAAGSSSVSANDLS